MVSRERRTASGSRAGLWAGVVCAALAAGPAFAQPRPEAEASEAARSELLRVRYQIRVMEGVLERAVEHAATVVNERMRAFAPDLLLLTGAARVRGFRLDGYGLFFDVDVPALRQSVSWSIRTLRQNNLRAERALDRIRRLVDAQRDDAARAELEQALRLLELRVGPALAPMSGDGLPASSDGVQNVAVAGPLPAGGGLVDNRAEMPAVPAPRPPGAPAGDASNDDPGEIYTSEVRGALIDAMLDYSGPMSLGDEDWLVVAARDNGDLGVPGDAGDTATIILRIKGADLTAYRAGRLTRPEARGRVEVRTF
jgi:hypothetical protein